MIQEAAAILPEMRAVTQTVELCEMVHTAEALRPALTCNAYALFCQTGITHDDMHMHP